jgi:hypothetical protein
MRSGTRSVGRRQRAPAELPACRIERPDIALNDTGRATKEEGSLPDAVPGTGRTRACRRRRAGDGGGRPCHPLLSHGQDGHVTERPRSALAPENEEPPPVRIPAGRLRVSGSRRGARWDDRGVVHRVSITRRGEDGVHGDARRAAETDEALPDGVPGRGAVVPARWGRVRPQRRIRRSRRQDEGQNGHVRQMLEYRLHLLSPVSHSSRTGSGISALVLSAGSS